MAWRFRKSITLGKFTRLNFGKRGVGVSVGIPGLRVGVGSRGPYSSVGIPGTGVYNVSHLSSGASGSHQAQEASPQSSNPQRGCAVAAKGCGIAVLLLFGGCFVLAVLAPRERTSNYTEMPSVPSQQAPATAEIQTQRDTHEKTLPTISPGKYTLGASVLFLPVMSSEEYVKKSASTIPKGGMIEIVTRESKYGGEWYQARCWDAAGNVYGGYLDGHELTHTELLPYKEPSAVKESSDYTGAYEGTPQDLTPTPTVYVAPESGQKYHSSRTCRGLNKASQVLPLSRDEAISNGYSPCKICTAH